jgi:hypothetical protein
MPYAAAGKKTAPPKRWSREVTLHSNAMDLEDGVFAQDSPAGIARSLKRSADSSKRLKASPFQSAMSMLNFYINRAGKTLPAKQKRVLNDAKAQLRRLYQIDGGHVAKKVGSTSSKGKGKVHKVLKEYKQGELKSGSGKKVASRKQAVAIALNEARRSGAKVPPKEKEVGYSSVSAGTSIQARFRHDSIPSSAS